MTHSPTCTGCPLCPGDVGELARAIVADPTNIALADCMANPERRPAWRSFAALAAAPPNPYAPRAATAMSTCERESLGAYADGIAKLREVNR